MGLERIKPIPLHRLSKGLSATDRIRYGIIYLTLSKSDVQEMKAILKKESKKIIAELEEPKLSIVKAMEQYLNSYIESLSKRDTFRLYMAYLEVREAVGMAQEHYAKLEFLIKMYRTYMKKGWATKKHSKVRRAVKKAGKAKIFRKLLKKKPVKAKKRR